MIVEVQKDFIDLEQREREKAARLRVLRSLPNDIEITGVHMYPLYGTTGSVGFELDGDHKDVVLAIRELIRKLPPEPAERISASCAWTQPKGHREKSHKQDYESSHTKIIPICPIWARADNVVKNSQSSLEFHWFTKTHEMLEDGALTTVAKDILLRVDVKVLQPHNWIRYRYDVSHSRGANDITVNAQVFSHKFVEAQLQVMGRGSNSQTWGYDVRWEDIKSVEDALRVSEGWSEKHQGR
jgi:hypothetical protein